jgi:dihydroorotase
LISNGTLITENGPLEADILCDNGVITALCSRRAHSDVNETLDAQGQLVFPGFIDPHVHSRDPGLTYKEDFWHSTLGALCGGITTVLEMPNAIPPVTTDDIFRQRRAAHEKNAWTDFGLWGMAIGTENINELASIFESGAIGVKFFWGYALDRKTKALVHNITTYKNKADLLLPPEHGEVLEIFNEVARVGGVLAAHCEDHRILASSAQALRRPIQTYRDLLTTRPAIAEATTIAVGAEFARATHCHFHVVHVSSAQGAKAVHQAQSSGVPITAETCPHYLTLTERDAERLGSVSKVFPPIRYQEDQDALWTALKHNILSSLGSDHAPHTTDEKTVGYSDAPGGSQGIETLAPLMVDAMLHGKLTATQLASRLSTSTAKIYGLYPRKGTLSLGSDADLTIVDSSSSSTIRNEHLHALNPLSPWDGRKLKGRITASVLRGQIAMRDSEPVGQRRGTFVPADR